MSLSLKNAQNKTLMQARCQKGFRQSCKNTRTFGWPGASLSTDIKSLMFSGHGLRQACRLKREKVACEQPLPPCRFVR